MSSFTVAKALFQKQQSVLLSLEAANPRSPHWRALEQELKIKHPYCSVCGEDWEDTQLIAHHVKPYHKFRELELEPDNIIILGQTCSTGQHHLLLGHFGNFKKWNPDIKRLASVMLANRNLKELDYVPVPIFGV